MEERFPKMDRRRVQEILHRLEELERELSDELQKGKESIQCDFLEERIPLWEYVRKGKITYLFSVPFIYGMIIPALIMDLGVTIYQAACFPIYGIPKVRRRDYIVIDRQHLPYLNPLQKLNCVYCGYFNGLIAYVREIASRTEQFWCPIRHARHLPDAPPRTWRFIPYGDGRDLHTRWKKLREALKEEERTSDRDEKYETRS